MKRDIKSEAPFSLYKLPKLNKASIPVILWNLFPVFGVVFLSWDPASVFICYALETIIVGAFNVLKMLAVYKYGLPPKANETGLNGLGTIPFFIVHYYFFVFVQLTMFFSGRFDTLGPRALIEQIQGYFWQSSFSTALGVFIINNMLQFINDLFVTDKYTKRTMSEQMFEPYPRIIIQQVVVIFGGFIYSITGFTWPVLIVFVAVKIYVDLLVVNLDIRQLLEKLKKIEARNKT